MVLQVREGWLSGPFGEDVSGRVTEALGRGRGPAVLEMAKSLVALPSSTPVWEHHIPATTPSVQQMCAGDSSHFKHLVADIGRWLDQAVLNQLKQLVDDYSSRQLDAAVQSATIKKRSQREHLKREAARNKKWFSSTRSRNRREAALRRYFIKAHLDELASLVRNLTCENVILCVLSSTLDSVEPGSLEEQ